MTKHGFTSVFSSYLESFLEDRYKRGFTKEKYLPCLRSFDRMCVDRNHNHMRITEKLYNQWFSTLSYLGDTTLYARVGELRMFAYYLTKMGYPCYIPRLPKHKKSDYVPYIYTHEEIERVFKSSEKVKIQSECRSTVLVLPVLIRLLYSTGMRIGEALSICNRDINFDKHVINLYQTKNGHERLAPINTSMEVVLRQYISFRNRLPIPDVSAPWNYLFVSLRGTQIKKNAVDYHFKKILEDAEVIDIYNGKLPRIHDLRHTACVHAMHKILIQGKDLYCHLPILAVFMGHIKVNDTGYYLRLVRQQYPDLIKQQVSVVESITEIVNRALIIKSEDYV